MAKNSNLKLCRKRDGSIIIMERIWVCDDCGKTYAGDKAYHIYDIFGKEKYICIPCREKGVRQFILEMDKLTDICKKDI